MGRHELTYPKAAHSTVKRHDERGVYALKTIHEIVNASPLLTLSFNIPSSPYPMSLPMIGQMGSFSRPSADIGDPLDLYVHGYVSSRVMNVTRKDEQDKGLPVSVCVSHCDGIVLALSSFNHSYNYRSVVLFGHAQLVEDLDERLYAMELITNSVVPDRFRHTRLPLNNAELQSTSILRIRIDNGSAKIRTGNVAEDKKDAEDEQLVAKTWTGILPMYSRFGEPVPAEGNKIDVPGYIREFVDEYSKDNEEYSQKAIGM